MSNAFYHIEKPKNEHYLSYAQGTKERDDLKKTLTELKKEDLVIPAVINGKEVKTGRTVDVHMPHNLSHKLATVHLCGEKEVKSAIKGALKAREEWANTPWQDRVAVFLRAADIITGPMRYTMNATTMMGLSKTPQQSEIEAVGELADFFRFNAWYLTKIYKDQPFSPEGMWNRLEYRPLEGFVFAVTPFNFTAIAGNLPAAPVMCGNVAIWKPSTESIYANWFVLEALKKAGLPDGVIQFLPGDGPDVGDPVLENENLAGLHFTGSEGTFNHLWKTIGKNIDKYKSYPRIVGETGGKDFIFAHNSADMDRLVPAAVRGAFEYQGQKCSAASRMYVPKSIWPEFSKRLKAEVKKIKMGDVEDFSNFMGAVISRKAFDKISGYIDFAKDAKDAEIIAGGGYDDSKGYFIEPTVIVAKKPDFKTMKEEIFGPVLTIYVYEDDKFEETLEVCDQTSKYGLTGAIWARNRYVINQMADRLRNSAGNFYINDKPTGAVVNQQPFGGARKSGTNDKAGSMVNLYKWISMRSIKETYAGPTDWKYPYMGEK
jgi:1-pyrroline-5-carboxylate dehydrogenase